jgi:hypothetical protein
METETDVRRGSAHQRMVLEVGFCVGVAVALAVFAVCLMVRPRPIVLSAVIAFALWAAVYFAFALIAHMPWAWWRAKWRDPLEVLGIVAPDDDPLQNLRRPPRP